MLYSEFVRTTFAYTKEPPTPVMMDLCHCIFGIVAEYIELWNEDAKCLDVELDEHEHPDFTKVHKEIGDILYYNTMLKNILVDNHLIEKNTRPTELESDDDLSIELLLEELADLGKKRIFYKHDIDYNRLYRLTEMMGEFLFALALEYNTTLQEIREQNETKLRKRYSSGTFTPEEAARKADVNG